MSLLSLRAVAKRYGSVLAVDSVDLDVAEGSRTAIVGPSGSGKTTLLRLIAGFETPEAGAILLDGVTLANGSGAMPAHRRSIGYVAQDGALFPHLSVADNIAFGLDRRASDRAERVRALMATVELAPAMAERRPHQLSGGQQQRVALARALARRPRLMLLDEPFSALDAGLREQMRRATAEMLTAAGITTLLVTHDQTEALSFADQIAVLRGGRIAQAGSPRDVYLKPRDRETALFLGEAIMLPAILGDGTADSALGRLPAATEGRRGSAEIMLRPEQVRLTPVTAAANGGGPSGTVTEVEFSGAMCTMTVAVADPRGGTPTILSLKASSADALAKGTVVRIAIAGEAHVIGGG